MLQTKTFVMRRLNWYQDTKDFMWNSAPRYNTYNLYENGKDKNIAYGLPFFEGDTVSVKLKNSSNKIVTL